MQAMHHKLAKLSDLALELKLATLCLCESKVQTCVCLVSELMGTLAHADRTIDATLKRVAIGLTDVGRPQAALGNNARRHGVATIPPPQTNSITQHI